MKTVIINYNSGNIYSVLFALERIGINALVTDNKDEICSADKIILPGVGQAANAMHFLKEKGLDVVIPKLKQPVLGICLGMQLLCNYSEEGNTKCFGIFEQNIKLFPSQNLKVPQVGWNKISNLRSTLFSNIQENDYQYLVHSYYAELSENTIAQSDYGIIYSAALQKNNFYGVQFHPERSGLAGQTILENFIKF